MEVSVLYYTLVPILLANIIGLFGYHHYYIRKLKTSKREIQEQIVSDLSSDFHDELGAHLAKIINMAGALKITGHTKADSQYLDKIIESAQSLFQGMTDIMRFSKNGSTYCENLYLEISDFGNSSFEYSEMEFSSQFKSQLNQATIDAVIVKDVTLSVKELITNSLRHSKGSKVSVLFAVEKRCLLINVADNGRGFQVDKVMGRGGLSNLKKRAKRSAFTYSSVINQGSIFKLIVPIKHV